MMKFPSHKDDEGIPSMLIDLNDEEDESTGMNRKNKGKRKMITTNTSDDGDDKDDENEEAGKVVEPEPSKSKTYEKTVTTSEPKPKDKNDDMSIAHALELIEEERIKEILAKTKDESKLDKVVVEEIIKDEGLKKFIDKPVEAGVEFRTKKRREERKEDEERK